MSRRHAGHVAVHVQDAPRAAARRRLDDREVHRAGRRAGAHELGQHGRDLAPDRRLRLAGRAADVRREDHVGQPLQRRAKPVGVRLGLFGVDVDGGAGQVARAQRRRQRRDHHDGAAAGVEQDSCRASSPRARPRRSCSWSRASPARAATRSRRAPADRPATPPRRCCPSAASRRDRRRSRACPGPRPARPAGGRCGRSRRCPASCRASRSSWRRPCARCRRAPRASDRRAAARARSARR